MSLASTCIQYLLLIVSMPHGVVTHCILLGHCNPPIVNFNAIVDGYINGKEGSEITVHCQFGQENSESIVSTCVSGGQWSPDPAKFTCEGMTMAQLIELIE